MLREKTQQNGTIFGLHTKFTKRASVHHVKKMTSLQTSFDTLVYNVSNMAQ